ncbi:MAG: hypothetical protein LBN26_02595 [Christensenellaceae bacterium]|nr:hypothetical protein [Christensenellaceae bacterium]
MKEQGANMKVWAMIKTDDHIVRDTLFDVGYAKRGDVQDWPALVGEACHALDLARPVILRKHLHDISAFSRVVFKPDDFMEQVVFDRFEIEILFDKKADAKNK